jgi:hypothetical protein
MWEGLFWAECEPALIREGRENCTVRNFIIFAYCPDIIKRIKLRRISWAGLMPCMRKMTNS